LYREYCEAAAGAVEDDWVHAVDSSDRVDLLRFHLRDLNDRASELEDWFAGANTEIVPPSLVDAVERELGELLAIPRQVILSIGSADNYETLISELQDLVLGALGPHRPVLDPILAGSRFALLRLPRLESSEPSWRPLILAHEVGHLALIERSSVTDFDIEARLDPAHTATLSVPAHLGNLRSNPALAIKTVGEEWVEELICDAYAVRRFGPAAVAALGGFFEFVGAFDELGDHPPGWLRCRLLVHWLGHVDSVEVERVVEPWRELAALSQPAMPDWAQYLCSVLWDARDEFASLLTDWPDAYDINPRSQLVEWLANELRSGIARADEIGFRSIDEMSPLVDSDIINAGWIARQSPNGMPIDQLVEKSLESLDFIRRWLANGGDVTPIDSPAVDKSQTAPLLSSEAIRGRLLSGNASKRLVVSPSGLSSIRGASIDVRLGKHFIVFERSSTPALSAAFGGARRMQAAVEKSWDDYFVLHPGELVLASTLEYLMVPSDLAATVITRSSYGRLGLLTATAIFVHPWYKGCLTLELINLGRVPLQLQPGERIAQLTFQRVGPPSQQPDEADKYRCNTRPEFSRVSLDEEGSILKAISRHQFED
jgi:deoxycytidine triphosphate deaminase